MEIFPSISMFFLWHPPPSPREEAGPSMQSRRWAAAGPEPRTWRRWRRSWTQAWTPAAAPPAGSPPRHPLPLKPRASTTTPVRRPPRWPRCPRRARGGGAWQPRWASRHPGPRVPLLATNHQVGVVFYLESRGRNEVQYRTLDEFGLPWNFIDTRCICGKNVDVLEVEKMVGKGTNVRKKLFAYISTWCFK